MNPDSSGRYTHGHERGVLASHSARTAANSAAYPELPELERWRQTYRAAARANGAEPDAGRRLRAWAHAAGIANPRITASVWNYADTEACRWLGDGWAERCAGETFSRQAKAQGLRAADIAGIVDAWRKWGGDPDAWLCMPHGELLAQISGK